jgi:DNA invertase Pin-like site-specific DNA recombinase
MALRFAPLIRVSTEGQATKGESLKTQTAQIRQYVKSLGGIIPEHCWKYSGQEHATPEQERIKLEQLLADSSNGKFDAVIVCDASRWSRDNMKSKEGLNILRNNGIRFFVGTMEYDLFNPEHNFILGMSAEVGELQARQQALKSITNRIERARRGIPTAGKLPYGRTFDKQTETWGIDPEKKRNIEWAAEQYLGGMGLTEIAKILDMNFSNLWKILNERSGTEWQCAFRNDKVNVDETIPIEIPPLLDEETIAAIKEKARANKTYTHGEIKNRYLLARMIFCDKCGYTLFGQTNHSTKRYYRHPHHARKKDCDCKKWISADRIEAAVLLYLFDMFGDAEKIEKAIQRATPDLSKIEKLRDEKADLEEKKAEAVKQRQRIVKLAATGALNEEEVRAEIQPIRDRIQAIQDRLDAIEPQIADQPDPEQIKRKSQWAKAVVVDALRRPGPKKKAEVLDWPYEQKRRIVENAFAGTDREGNRLGVYVTETGDPKKPFRFEIRAVLDQIVNSMLPESGIDNVLEELGIDIVNFSSSLPAPALPLCRSPLGSPRSWA